MYLSNEPVLHCIIRHDKHGKRFEISRSRIGVYNQITVLILASGIPHRLHKGAVQLIDSDIIIIRRIRPLITVIEHFVQTLENQSMVVIPKPLRNLTPKRRNTVFGFFNAGVIRLDPSGFTRIVMYIQNTYHVVVQDITDHFFHPVQPVRIHRAIFIHMVVPCDRNPHGIKAGLLDFVNHIFGGYRIAPCGLVIGNTFFLSVNNGVKRIAKAPADQHMLSFGENIVRYDIFIQ